MESLEALADVGKAYVDDIQVALSAPALVICCLAITISVLPHGGEFESIWLLAASTSLAQLVRGDGSLLLNLTITDLGVAALCALGGRIVLSIFRKLVIWVFTSSTVFSQLMKKQALQMHSKKSLDESPKVVWLREKIKRKLIAVKRKDFFSELLCGLAVVTLVFGSLTSSLDITVILASVAAAYTVTQAGVREYIGEIFPFVMALANLHGFEEKAVSTNT